MKRKSTSRFRHAKTPEIKSQIKAEGGAPKVANHTTEPLDEHLVGFLISQGHSRPRAQQEVARDPEGVKKLKRQMEEDQKPQED